MFILTLNQAITGHHYLHQRSYTIYVDDLEDAVTSKLLKFANDTKHFFTEKIKYHGKQQMQYYNAVRWWLSSVTISPLVTCSFSNAIIGQWFEKGQILFSCTCLVRSVVYAGSKCCLSLDMCTAFAKPCELRLRTATANVALTLMKYTHVTITWGVKLSEQSYVLETLIQYIRINFFFFYLSRQINTRPHFVLPVHKTGGRVSA